MFIKNFNFEKNLENILIDFDLFKFFNINDFKIAFFKQDNSFFYFNLNKSEKDEKNILIEKDFFNEKTVLIKNFDNFINSKEFANNIPIRTILDFLLTYSIIKNATDLHFDYLNENLFIVKFKINTIFEDFFYLKKNQFESILLCLKILCQLDNININESKTSSFFKFFNGKFIDFRLSTHPTIFLERFVIRVLHKKNVLNIEDLNLSNDVKKIVDKVIFQPNGFIIVSGPTNSGKTTFVHSILKEISKQNICVMTLEDPVEYKIEGIIQTNINENFTFLNGLKSVLRQDPSVVFIGEIRDKETAKLAMQAALTGHKIIATIHSYSNNAVIQRLLDFEIKPNIIAECLFAIFSLRLFRKFENNVFTNLNLLVDSFFSNEDFKNNLFLNKIPIIKNNLYFLAKNLIENNVTTKNEILRVLGDFDDF